MTTLVQAQGRMLALEGAIVGIHWLGEVPAFALGDGRIAIAAEGKDTRFASAHEGGLLCVALHPNGEEILSGGDDGRVVATDVNGASRVLAAVPDKWVQALTASANSGVIVAAIGKDALVFVDEAESHRFTHASSVSGLALEPKGRRLAVSHYGGVTLHYALAGDDAGVALEWKGSHLGVTMSPDSVYVITAMQEKELHLWRLPQKSDLRMSGYLAKTRAMSWDARGRWLATSGADCAVVWPFQGKHGPQGKQPLTLMPREHNVTCVAFHPSEEILAVGYGDGVVMAVRLSDQIIIAVDDAKDSSEAGAVNAIAWSADGDSIAYGDEAGRGGVARLTT